MNKKMDNTKNAKEEHGMQAVKYIPVTVKNGEFQELTHDDGRKKPDTLYLYFTLLTGMLLVCSGSTAMVWASSAVVKLKSNSTEVNPLGKPITTLEISMLLGLPSLAATTGPLLFPKFADIMGRKKTIHIIGVGMFFSIIGQAFSNKIELIILFFSFVNALYFASLAIFPTYLTEVCEDHNRGKSGCIIVIFIPLGNLFVYAVGPLLSLRSFTLLTAAPLVPFLILFLFAPESPIYSLSKGRNDECVTTLRKLRSNKSAKALEMDFSNLVDNLSAIKRKRNGVLALFKTKERRIGFMFALLPLVVQIFSGVLVVMALLAPIFNETGTNLSVNTAALIVGLVSFLSSILSCMAIEKFGRKPLLVTSAVGVGLCVSILGLFFFLKHIDSPVVQKIQLLPVISVSFYIVFYCLGLGTVPLAILGELFLSDVRAIAVGVLLSISSGLVSFVNFTYPILTEVIGTHWCLWTFAVCCFSGAVVIHVVLPETKGKAILEIQEMLKQY